MADDIAKWLEGLGLGRYAQAFAENDIDVEVLSRLTDDDLKELGLSIGHRRKLQAAVEALSSDERATRPQASPAREAEPKLAEAERRQLTVLFCDLVGSTAMSSRLDPEDMREVLRAYQDACSGVIARYDGYVAKFMGDGVYAYFGYPRAHEDDAERAITAGLGIVEAVGGLEHDLAVRIGVATGTVAVGDIVGEGASEEANVVGEAPNLAARLQEIAQPNTVVIGEATRNLAAGLVETLYLGKRDFKGFARPVSAWSAIRPGRTESRFEATRGEHLTELVGRDEEMEILRRRWERAKNGEGQLVLITGEPGIGKSRLAHELQDQTANERPTVLTAQFASHHVNSAMFPFVEQMRRAIGFEPEDTNPTRLDKLEEWVRHAKQSPDKIVPIVAPILGFDATERYPMLEVAPERRKVLLFEAFAERLSNRTAQNPVLYVVEDAHWADPTTLELLGLQFERFIGRAPILFVVTYRPEFAPPWVGQSNTTVLTLNRLDRAQSAKLVENASGGEHLQKSTVEQITQRTDGVPLFVEELTKAVLESSGEDLGTSPLDVPATLQDSL